VSYDSATSYYEVWMADINLTKPLLIKAGYDSEEEGELQNEEDVGVFDRREVSIEDFRDITPVSYNCTNTFHTQCFSLLLTHYR
jgi:hypothetical protein